MTKKKLPRFELLSSFHKETEQHRKRGAEYAASVKEAEALVQELKLKKDNAINAEVVNGVNNKVELGELTAQLENAERDLTIARQKYQVASHISSRTITLQDVETAFLEFSKQYQDDHVEATIEELRKAKEAYAEKYIELARVLKHHDEMNREVTFTVKPKAITTLYGIRGLGTRQRREYATISEYDNEQLQNGILPRSISENNGGKQ